MQNYNSKFKIIFISIIYLVLFPVAAQGAVLYLEPASGEYYQGDIFIVEVKLSAGEEEINAVKAGLVFSQDLLEIKDFSRGESVLVFWPEEPVFSSEKGSLSFVGGIPGGFQGDGLLGKIIFKVRQAPRQIKLDEEGAAAGSGQEKEAKLKFLESSQLLLNDGLGTPAQFSAKEAVFTILPEKSEVARDEWQEILREDNVPPEPFEIIVAQDTSMFEGRYFIVFFTTDRQVGIDYYEVLEADKRGYRPGTSQKAEWERGQSPYLLQDQSLKSIIKVKAVDKAGNERIVEWAPPAKPLPYGRIVLVLLVLLGTGIIWRTGKRLKRRSEKT